MDEHRKQSCQTERWEGLTRDHEGGRPQNSDVSKVIEHIYYEKTCGHDVNRSSNSIRSPTMFGWVEITNLEETNCPLTRENLK